jgi:ABC-2 type transport system permease protein
MSEDRALSERDGGPREAVAAAQPARAARAAGTEGPVRPGGPAGSLRATAATARRVVGQLRHDPRTVGLLLVVPCLLVVLFKYVYYNSPLIFDRIGPLMVGLFPFITMFLVTSIAMVRERTSGTLERLLTTPMRKFDLLLGYALAFGLAALLQATITAGVTLGALGLTVRAGAGIVVMLAVINALLGMALGLFLSAFATTEFQAVQFMPAAVVPQILLCGLLNPREGMVGVLRWISDALPLTWAVDAINEARVSSELTAGLLGDAGIVLGCCLAALALGAATLRRQTP